jgi:hypothetical protein
MRGSACRKASTYAENKRTQTFKPRVGFKLMTPLFERAKTVCALDCVTTVISRFTVCILVNICRSFE